jgi:hypothetical protein
MCAYVHACFICQVCESYSVASVMLRAVRVQINTLWFLVRITQEHIKVMKQY